MKDYRRVMLGSGSKYADECYANNFIGLDYGINQDLSNYLPENWREFNDKYIPVYLESHPDKTKIAAGLACGNLWVVCKGLNQGDLVLCPDGQQNYYVGEIDSDYWYESDGILPHRRSVKWYPVIIESNAMSEDLRKSVGAGGAVVALGTYAEEIEELIGGDKPPTIISSDDTIEEPSEFALEKHLEHFLVQNWQHTPLGKEYDIYEDEGELVGQQYPSDTGPIDILAISKDKKTLLVVELKKGRASDHVVGQVQRYMGFVKHELAEPDQKVQGIIIALEDDIRIRRALSVTNDINFYRYQVHFELFKEF